MITKAELVQNTDADLIWRRREMTSFRAVVQDSDADQGRRPALLRAGIALLYAHWEGYVKRCGTWYLQFVANQRRKASELRTNFLAIKLKAHLAEASKSKKASACAELIEFFSSKLGDRLRIPYKGIVDTKANLSSTVLRDIVWTLGLEMAPYETKCHFIDTSLVERRNRIAHGDGLDITVVDYLAIHGEVMTLLDTFRNQIQNAALTDGFIR